MQLQQPQHLLTVCKAEDVLRKIQLDPRYLNGVKLDDFEWINIE